MATQITCPEVCILEQLLLGKVSGPEAAALEEHLLHCEQCAQKVNQLKPEDTLVEGARAAAGSTLHKSEDAVVQGLMKQLQGLRPVTPSDLEATAALSASGVDLTSAPSEEATSPPETPSSVGEDTQASYQFLAPGQGPGELGRLGPYRVLKVLGAGGMGVVFQAEDPHLERMVALKAMLPALASHPQAKQRFLREAKAAAAVKHDHIVHIYQVGEDRGVPFLAMEFLEGEALDDRLKREGRLPVSVTLRLGREIAEGLAAAHERGLIHRDIKPGNIWLESFSASTAKDESKGSDSGRRRARVKILDFGLARAARDTSHLTDSGAIVGTPAYMAPEQTRGEGVDSRADLFSLGCVLYRMVTGQLPFKGRDTIAILAALALDNPPAPQEVDSNIPSALSNLVMQLLAKDPADRPAAAAAVVEALEAIEREQAAFADVLHGPGPTRHAGKGDSSKNLLGLRQDSTPSFRLVSPSRRRWAVAAMLLGVLGLAGYLFAPAVYRVATNQGQLVVVVNDPNVEVVLGQQGVTIHDRANDRKYTVKPGRQDLPAGAYEVEVAEAAGGLHFSTREFTITRNGQAAVKVTLDQGVAAKAIPEDVQKERPGAAEAVGEVRLFEGQTGPVWSVHFTPDGRRVLSGSDDNTLRLWDVNTGKELRRFDGGGAAMALSSDGRFALSNNNGNTLVLWDVEKGRVLRTLLGHTAYITGMGFSPDGRSVFSCAMDKTVRMWDLGTGKELRQFKGHTGVVQCLALSADGHRLLTGSYDLTARLWDVESGAELRRFEGHTGWIFDVAFSPDGRRLLTASMDTTARLWNLDTGKELGHFEAASCLEGVAFSPDGRRILTGGQDNTVRLWDVAGGRELVRFVGHTARIHRVAFSPDGRYALSGSADKTMRLWRLPLPESSF